MIFATLGTHEQPMPRLADALEALAVECPERGPFWIQHGYTRLPGGWAGQSLMGRARLCELLASADVVVAHAGAATVAEARAAGKIPIVVPRRSALREHVNDHQLACAQRLAAERQVLMLTDTAALSDVIARYEELVAELPPPAPHDPAPAIERFSAIADQLLSGR
jgi:UDP-N-acetylglucosamine transferase subunit ALG13